LIGRGLTSIDFRTNENSPDVDRLDLVPTFGWPASDILLAAEPGQVVPLVPISRLSVINGTEIKSYLDKLKQYEAAQASTSQAVTDKAWMKALYTRRGAARLMKTAILRITSTVMRRLPRIPCSGPR
jgi:hypothetical protein